MSGPAASPGQARVRGWWSASLWGVGMLLVGIFLVVQPASTAGLLVRALAVVWLVGGVAELAGGVRGRGSRGAGLRLAAGIVGVAAGVLLLANPLLGAQLSVHFQYLVLGIAAVATGALHLAALPGGPFSAPAALSAVAQAALGIYLLVVPPARALDAASTLGVVLVAAGAAVLLLGLRARRTA